MTIQRVPISAPRKDPVGRLLMRGAALLVTAGLALGGYTGWDWWRRVQQVDAAQAELNRAPDAPWAARLYLPSLHLRLAIVEGVSDDDLLRGPGHIPGTAEFGADGNTAVAGHRYPGVFWDLDRLAVGAPAVVETHDAWYVYRVDSARIVGADTRDVLRAPASGSILTLVTCEPKFSTARRLIRQAVLVSRLPQGPDRPAELG